MSDDSEKIGKSIWVAYNEDGDIEVSTSSVGDALDTLTSNCGGEAQRVVRVKLRFRLPKVGDVSVDVPDEIEVVEAEASAA